MKELIEIMQKKSVRRLLIFALLIFILYTLRSMLNVMLLTFIFAFLVDRLETLVVKYTKLPRKLIVVLIYTSVVALFYATITHYLPVIVKQVTQLFNSTVGFFSQGTSNRFIAMAVDFMDKYNIKKYMDTGVDFLVSSLTSMSSITINVFIALLLSFFFSLSKEHIVSFTKGFKHSAIGFIYDEVAYFGSRFVGTFGKVMEAQFIIAFFNTLATTLVLWLLNFPQLVSLALMIFVLSLIPVAGVVISLIPLSIIGYTIGGITDVIYMIITVIVIHAIEAYILNPKIMSSKTELPIFYTFIVLIFSEHFFGVWGLIIGIPVFMFLVDVIGAKPEPKEKKPIINNITKKIKRK